MALELVKLDSATLPGIADAIREKTGGTEPLLPSQMAAAIEAIPTGGDLPELTTPAEVGHVLAGKEYIDADGAKKAGTLVVCDTIEIIEYFGEPGTGVYLALESAADGSTKDMMLPESNLVAVNIKSGVRILGVLGSAKTLTVETGTITPAEDITSLELPCTANPKMVIVCLTDAALETVVQDDMVAAMRAHVVGATYAIGSDSNTLNATLAITQYHNSGGKRGTVTTSCAMDPVKIAASSTYQWRAGLAYAWTAYYWEDD